MDTSSATDLRDVAVRSILATATGDRAEFAALIHPDCVDHENAVQPPASRVNGPAGMQATALWLRAAFADLRYDTVRTVRFDLGTARTGAWERPFGEMAAELLERLAADGIEAGRARVERTMDLRYRGQNYELEVAVAPSLDAGAIRRRFTDRHRRRYGYETGEPVECLNLRLSVLVPSDAHPARVSGVPAERSGGGGGRSRRIFFYGRGWMDAPVHPRGVVGEGRRVAGPAVVHDEWSTIVVYPEQTLRGDADGLLWIEAAS